MPASTSSAATEARTTEMVISSGDAFPSRDTEVLNSDNASTAIPAAAKTAKTQTTSAKTALQARLRATFPPSPDRLPEETRDCG